MKSNGLPRVAQDAKRGPTMESDTARRGYCRPRRCLHLILRKRLRRFHVIYCWIGGSRMLNPDAVRTTNRFSPKFENIWSEPLGMNRLIKLAQSLVSACIVASIT
jgi:hypothetical protein